MILNRAYSYVFFSKMGGVYKYVCVCGPGIDSRCGLCIYPATRPSLGTVSGVPSLNDLAVDGT